jgi:hypothetical protein
MDKYLYLQHQIEQTLPPSLPSSSLSHTVPHFCPTPDPGLPSYRSPNGLWLHPRAQERSRKGTGPLFTFSVLQAGGSRGRASGAEVEKHVAAWTSLPPPLTFTVFCSPGHWFCPPRSSVLCSWSPPGKGRLVCGGLAPWLRWPLWAPGCLTRG